MKLTRALFAILIALALLAQSGEREIPKCKGEQCRGEGPFDYRMDEGPLWCQNYHGNGYKPNCEKCRNEDDCEPTSKCATHCRSKACRCKHPGCST